MMLLPRNREKNEEGERGWHAFRREDPAGGWWMTYGHKETRGGPPFRRTVRLAWDDSRQQRACMNLAAVYEAGANRRPYEEDE